MLTTTAQMSWFTAGWQYSSLERPTVLTVQISAKVNIYRLISACSTCKCGVNYT